MANVSEVAQAKDPQPYPQANALFLPRPRTLDQAVALMYGAQGHWEDQVRLAIDARVAKYEAEVRMDWEKPHAIERMVVGGMTKTDASKRYVEDSAYAKLETVFRLAALLADTAEQMERIARQRLETTRECVKTLTPAGGA